MDQQANSPMNDNITYCDKCLKPTLRYDEARKTYFPTRCDCQQDEPDEYKEMKYNEERRRFRDLQKASMLGERYKNASFENTVLSESTHESFRVAFECCQNFCKNADEVSRRGWGMYLYGASGVGKTHLTACVCNELLKNQKQCLFTNFFEISKAIRATFNSQDSDATLINKICGIEFLFIDDIGTERLRANGADSWLQEQIFDILNKRYNNKKSTIFTSNHSISQLVEDCGLMDKTADRINEMSKRIIKIEGGSYRLKIANDPNDLF